MDVPKLLFYTCTAVAAGGLSARAQEVPDAQPLVLDDFDRDRVSGEDLIAARDRVPETAEVLPHQLDTPPEILALQPESLATTLKTAEDFAIAQVQENIAELPDLSPEVAPSAIALNPVDVEESEVSLPTPDRNFVTTASALAGDRIGVTQPQLNPNTVEIADATDATCVAAATPDQIAQGFSETCPRPRRYNAVEFNNDYEYRSSPAMSIYIPVGYGADNNTVFFTGNYQSEVRVDPGSTFNGGLGVGLGDADDAVGVELSYAFANNRNFGDGGFNGKIHHRFPGDVSVAAGWNGFLNFGRHDWEHSLYGVVTKVFRTQDSLEKPFSRVSVTAGVGTNQFRSNGARIVGDNNANFFGNVAVRVVRPVSLIAEWTGQDLGLGLSIAPFANIPFVITPAVRDVVGNEFSPRFVLTSGMSYQF
jgi:hypothetical protein